MELRKDLSRSRGNGMFHDAKHNPRGRFDGLGSVYAKHRPDYPADAIDWIVEKLPREGLIADVGAGTGILSRQLAQRGIRVIGIEPNASMRAEAALVANPLIDYRDGAAESTGLASNSVDGVAVGQAFHWFDRESALREFHRVLHSGGWLSLLWNIADETDPLTSEFWKILRSTTAEPDVVRAPHHLTGQILLDHSQFVNAECRQAANEQTLDEEGLVGRGFSASFAPKDCHASERFAERLHELFHEHSSGGCVRLRYRTTVYRAQRRG
jgi:ubiquinone/menaquinone biosynthesis C-methylase UbiE